MVTGGSGFLDFSVHFHSVTPTILFNRDNMATTTSRYYSEDGRATKRQKTDGMTTVSFPPALNAKRRAKKKPLGPRLVKHDFVVVETHSIGRRRAAGSPVQMCR